MEVNWLSVLFISCAVGVGVILSVACFLDLKRLFGCLRENSLRDVLEIIFKKRIVFTILAILFATTVALGIASVFTNSALLSKIGKAFFFASVCWIWVVILGYQIFEWRKNRETLKMLFMRIGFVVLATGFIFGASYAEGYIKNIKEKQKEDLQASLSSISSSFPTTSITLSFPTTTFTITPPPLPS